MTKLNIFIPIFLLISLVCDAQNLNTNKCAVKAFEVYLDDGENFSNIRRAPNGKISLKINNEESSGYMLNVIGYQNGWLKINNIYGLDDFDISEFEGWVHASIVGIGTTHNVELLDKPFGKPIATITGETGETFKIKGMQCEWVKLSTSQGTGWVKASKLCGNPVTTCP